MKNLLKITFVLTIAALSGCTTVVATRPAPEEHIWVCHGGRNAKWLRVSSAAVNGHSRHGDRISYTEQPAGAPCER